MSRDAARTSAQSHCVRILEILQNSWGRIPSQCRLLCPIPERLRDLWGRFSTCGGYSTRLGGICTLVGRPIENRPQVENLPHISILRASMNAEVRVPAK